MGFTCLSLTIKGQNYTKEITRAVYFYLESPFSAKTNHQSNWTDQSIQWDFILQNCVTWYTAKSLEKLISTERFCQQKKQVKILLTEQNTV